jgi:hypothetical protein
MTYVLLVVVILILIIGLRILKVIRIHKLAIETNPRMITCILVQCFPGEYVIALLQMVDVSHYLRYFFQMHAHLTANTVLIKLIRRK